MYRYSKTGLGIAFLLLILPNFAYSKPNSLSQHITDGIFLDLSGKAAPPANVEIRKVYNKGLDATKSFEGWGGRPYDDIAHYCTIGYGHLIKLSPCDGSEPKSFLAGIKKKQGLEILQADMGGAEWAVMSGVKVKLSDGQYAAICDFVFNVGPTNFNKSTLLKVLNRSDFDQVPSEMLRWVNAGGKPANGLRERRSKEIALFFDGTPIPKAAPPQGQIQTPVDIYKGE